MEMSGVLVHEWIESAGGAERVLDQFVEIFPELDLHCLWNDANRRYPDTAVTETLLGKTWLRKSKALALPLMPIQWRMLSGAEYDWALISTHLFAHHARFRNKSRIRKYAYVHTPARYIWEPSLDPRGANRMVRLLSPPLQTLDRRRASELFSVAANSKFIAERIERCWGISARTIYPPIDTERIADSDSWELNLTDSDHAIIERLPDKFILGASRLVSYKRLDRVIRLGELAELPVLIVGEGPDRARLTDMATRSKVPVHFVGRASDSLLYFLYKKCAVYAFLGIEDFGIMPVEAMAAGAAVIANSVGGAAETVCDRVTGALCDPDDDIDLLAGFGRAESCSQSDSIARARLFGIDRFRRDVISWIGENEDIREGGL